MKKKFLLLSLIVISIIAILISILFGNGFFISKKEINPNNQRVKNIVYVIGDGMGFSSIKATEIYLGKNLEITNSEHISSITTYSADNSIADSAASGTALSTGFKTNNHVIGLDKNGNKIKNLTELAREKGKLVGIVTTDLVTGATPATFSSHISSRNLEKEIFLNQLSFKPNVLFGGYSNEYAEDKILSSGMHCVRNIIDMNNLTKDDKYVLGLFSEEDLTNISNKNNTPNLVEMTKKAIMQMDNNEKGFFLVVEEAHIDKASHENNLDLMIKHQIQMDELVTYLKSYIITNPDTLIVITADHETGGITIPKDYQKSNLTNQIYTTNGHTAMDVPLISYGKQAEKFYNKMDNTDVAKNIAKLMGDNNFGIESK